MLRGSAVIDKNTQILVMKTIFVVHLNVMDKTDLLMSALIRQILYIVPKVLRLGVNFLTMAKNARLRRFDDIFKLVHCL